MIERILPGRVVGYETSTDPPEAVLLAEEEPVVRDAVPKRRDEFTTGRYCARRALAGLGLPERPLLSGPRGEPLWPEGVAGSITHCDGYRAAAVARTEDAVSLGIDAEPHQPLPHGILEAVALPEEQVRIAELLRRDPGVRWDRLLFSAKECVYKTWYPITGRPLGFEEATVDIDPAGGRFTARLAEHSVRGVPDAPRELTGRWMVGDGLVLAAIVRTAGPADRP
ncbi:4'-phosphopantetheinyl transferase [Streptomyces californicus]|uniref:4'-phosphopantetheinyl transferase family protein n=1 Tax=Streptomyces TaxID=1883 RepID=UPI000BF0BBF4|nr:MULTISPECIES: 4'-phosphopantetheinyl transferase superfamily protein [Streptomyces]MBK0372579.1 4'-phosphopantetheinyl transferase superfamily protein [Streptomyces sp. RB110-1]MBK0384704.1 4'-phosphopantetheinyl transferase superfamily protein [Streptomyces sp. RB110-2]MCF3170418.1 4'-phosphopantetheinyl transferase superfamily protein [Streptomyces violaceoruber]MDW4902442.1 4'-phosphopantetheinyl transferase superfamily protein [Streptomyces californicus]